MLDESHYFFQFSAFLLSVICLCFSTAISIKGNLIIIHFIMHPFETIENYVPIFELSYNGQRNSKL